MNIEYVISEKIIIEDANINEVYNKCISWMETQKVKFLEEERPFHIKALHSVNHPYKRQGKHIIVDLDEVETEVGVSFKIPHLEWKMHKGIYWIFWIEIMEEFYRYIGVEIDDELLNQFYNEEYYNAMIKGNKINAILFFIFSAVVIFYSIIYMPIMIILGVGISLIALPFYMTHNNLIKKRDKLFK